MDLALVKAGKGGQTGGGAVPLTPDSHEDSEEDGAAVIKQMGHLENRAVQKHSATV